MSEAILWLDRLRLADLAEVGGKNASLGEMIGHLASADVAVPGGFATTASAFVEYLAQSGLAERIEQRLSTLDIEDVAELASAGKEIRRWMLETPLTARLELAIRDGYA